jgi:hypothetical protein
MAAAVAGEAAWVSCIMLSFCHGLSSLDMLAHAHLTFNGVCLETGGIVMVLMPAKEACFHGG